MAREERMLGVRVGRIRGIPVEVGYSFFLLLFVAYYYGASKGVGPLMALLFAVLGAGGARLLCASLLPRESRWIRR